MKNIFSTKTSPGFTLIELVVAVAVSGIILSAIGTTLYQVFTNNMRNTSHLLAVKQVENALHFLVRDVQMSQDVKTTGLDPGEVLELSWYSWEANETRITYSWDSVQHTLTRKQSVDGTATTVAYSVNQVPIFTPAPFTQNDQKLTVKITCTVKDVSETRLVEIAPRPGV